MELSVNYGNLEEEWTDFTDQIIYGNRSFVEHPVLEILKKQIDKKSIDMKAGTELFRARIDKNNEVYKENSLYNNYLQEMKAQCQQGKERDEYIESIYPKAKIDKIQKRIQDGFLGFSKEDSFIPPVTYSNRCSPKYIRYLYTAEEFETAIAEVRPQAQDCVSVARIVLNEDYRFIDLYGNFSNNKELMDSAFYSLFRDSKAGSIKSGDDYRNNYFMNRLAMSFSTPVNSEDGYIITQYISQLIHHMKYDGVRFRSSLHTKGKNVTLFKDACESISSCLVQITNMVINHNYILFDNINHDYDQFQMLNDIIPNMKEKIAEKPTGIPVTSNEN